MSVLDVFGQNLRNLTALRGSQTSVANDLDIGRVQFQRYLRSESFPKPNLLKRICDYFGVDARILTELLTQEQLQLIEMGQQGVAVMSPKTGPINEAINYCVPDQDYFPISSELPDGIYQCWGGSRSRPDKALRWLRRLHTINGARVIRAYERRDTFPKETRPTGRSREIRGVFLKQKIGYAAVFFQGEPSRIITMDYLEVIDFGKSPAASGFSALAINKSSSPRLTRTLMYRLEGGTKELLDAGRASSFVNWDDVPPLVYTHIRPGNECF